MAVATTGGVPVQTTLRSELDETAQTLASAEKLAGDLLERLRGPRPPTETERKRLDPAPGQDCVRTATATIRAAARRLAAAVEEIHSLIG